MRRILLDQGVPKGVRSALSSFEVRSAYEMDWHELTNGTLISAAEAAGFDIFLTCDRNILYQQNLDRLRIAIVVLQTNHWPTIERSLSAVTSTIEQLPDGGFAQVPFERPTLKRRRHAPGRSGDS